MPGAKIYGVINVLLIAINLFVLFVPKRPVPGVPSNAAGGLILLGLSMIAIILIHIIASAIAIYKKKSELLKALTVIMVPCSLLFWYNLVPLIRF